MADHDLNDSIAAYIRHLRTSAGLTLQQYAEQLRPYKAFHPSMLQKIEAGNRGVTLDDLAAIAQAHGRTPAQFLDDAMTFDRGEQVDITADELDNYAKQLYSLATERMGTTWRNAYEAQAKFEEARAAAQRALTAINEAQRAAGASFMGLTEMQTNVTKAGQRLAVVADGKTREAAEQAFPFVVDGASSTTSDDQYAKHYGIRWFLDDEPEASASDADDHNEGREPADG